MADAADPQITRLLSRLRTGDAVAGEQLMPLIYADLHARAAAIMRGEQNQGTLQPTALVHEAWLRLHKNPGQSEWQDRRHFLRLAGKVMRNVLVDRARRRRATTSMDLTAGEQPRELDSAAATPSLAQSFGESIDVLDLHAALERLAERDQELEEIVTMRFFAGLTLRETAETLDKSVTSVHRAWELARTFLLRELRTRDS